MNYRLRWWQWNYHALRLGIATPIKFILNYDLRVEGAIPSFRPVMLAPVHRSSVDIYAISLATRSLISYVSTDTFGHSRGVNFAQKRLTRALGSIVWEQSGIANSRIRAVALAKDLEERLDRQLIVAAFAQGKYQPDAVESVEDGLLGLLKRYQSHHSRGHAESLDIPIVPVGIEYDINGNGFIDSVTASRLHRFLPYFPKWTVPAFGSKITVRFGEPQYFGSMSAEQFTDSVMREAARLSNIPYRVT